MTGDDDFFDGIYEPGFDSAPHYARWAGRYDDALTDNGYAQPRRVAAMATRLVLVTNGAVLDAGCGTGLSGEALAEAGFETIDGCDYSPEMLEVAAAKGVYRRTFVADLNETPIAVDDAAYDVITAVGVFGSGHVDPPAVDELLRSLRPGGALVIAVNDHYWNDGALATKLDDLAARGVIDMLPPERGEHIPGIALAGWVLGIFKEPRGG